jgi:transposase-like protein
LNKVKIPEEGEPTMREKFDEQFKAMVALEAVKEELRHQELAEKCQVYPNQISVIVRSRRRIWQRDTRPHSIADFGLD